MISLDLKEYDKNLIFAELRDENMGPGREKFHGDIIMVRSILLGRMEQRKIMVEDIVSNNPDLLERILSAHPILEFSDENVNSLFIRSLSEYDLAEIAKRAQEWDENKGPEWEARAYEETIALLEAEIEKDNISMG